MNNLTHMDIITHTEMLPSNTRTYTRAQISPPNVAVR